MSHEVTRNVVRWAVAFVDSELAQTSLRELKGTQSAAAPAEFLRLAEAVEAYKAARFGRRVCARKGSKRYCTVACSCDHTDYKELHRRKSK